MKYLKIVLCIALISLAAACAKVGDPRPPLAGTPERIQGVDVQQIGYSVVLSWTNPRAHVDGSPLENLSVVHVFQNGLARRPLPADQPGTRQSLTIPVNDALGVKHTFFLVAETKQGRTSESSNSVTIEPLDVPGPVDKLQGKVDRKRVLLTWDPPTEKRELANGYRVRRSDGGAEATVTTPSFEDRNYVSGQTYTYSVTPIRLNSASIAVPGPSERSINVEASDKTAPAAPAVLPTAVLEGDVGALITWSPNSEEDLKGYRVYSGPSRTGPFTVLADVERTAFTDKTHRTGVVYAVTAVDEAGNESETAIPTFGQ